MSDPALESPSISALQMDRGLPLGNSEDIDSRRALHVKIKNLDTEPINVRAFIVSEDPSLPPQAEVQSFNAITSVATGVTTDLITYTVPASKTFEIHKADVSGTNIAQFDFLINGTLSARKRTMFGASFNESFDFGEFAPALGLQFPAGTVLKIQVTHNRPNVGDFEARIQGLLIG